jgi:hypothetical protein
MFLRLLSVFDDHHVPPRAAQFGGHLQLGLLLRFFQHPLGQVEEHVLDALVQLGRRVAVPCVYRCRVAIKEINAENTVALIICLMCHESGLEIEIGQDQI